MPLNPLLSLSFVMVLSNLGSRRRETGDTHNTMMVEHSKINLYCTILIIVIIVPYIPVGVKNHTKCIECMFMLPGVCILDQ